MSSRYFYQDLASFSEFSEAFSQKYYQQVPDDYWIIIADIIGSTEAIEAGHYKNVNFVGTLPIIATINLLSPLNFAYVFGGDGATLLIADVDKQRVVDVLIATAQITQLRYGLKYRVGAIRVDTVRQHGSNVQLAKFDVSKNYQQAFFMGGGLSLADSLVKQEINYQVDINQTVHIKPDFSGLECRWQDIPSYRGQTLSLLIEVVNDDGKSRAIYKKILQDLEVIVGSKIQRSAVTHQSLTISLSPKQLSYEAKARSDSTHTKKQLFKIIIENILGKLLMKFSIHNWRFYKQNLIQTTDAEKFDDTLRMVIAATETQIQQLDDYLEQQYQQGKLIYGMHISNRALMTCLIFERHGQQVHFIDAADGGYALAAKGFKQRKRILLMA